MEVEINVVVTVISHDRRLFIINYFSKNTCMVRYKRQTTIHSNQKRFCSSCDSRRNESRSYGKSYRKELGVYMSYNSSSPRWAVSLFMYYPTPLTCWKEKKKKLGMRAAKCSVCVVVFLLVFASVPTSKVHLRFIFFSVCFA